MAARRRSALWLWVAASLPALVLLVLIVRWRVPVPYADSWAFVGQYRKWLDGEYTWANFFYKHGDHPSAAGKLIYFTVFHWMRGDVGLLPLLSWCLSAVVAVCVFLLSRRLRSGHPWLGAGLMSWTTLTIFNAAQGGVWLWDFSFQNFIPGTCLALGVVVLSVTRPGMRHILVSALLSLISVLSFGSGFLVGALLSLMVWRATKGRSMAQRSLIAGAFLLFTAVAAGIALKGFGPEGRPVSPLVLFDRPLMRLRFVLTLVGQMLGKGTILEPRTLGAVLGGALMTVFITCVIQVFRRRQNPELMPASLPWIVFCLFGIANATLICIGRMGSSSDSFSAFNNIYALADRTDAERFITLTHVFVFGVAFLAAAVVRHGGETGTPLKIPEKITGCVIGIFFAAQLLNWESGRQIMKMENILMRQERAMLEFAGLVATDPDRLWNRHTRGRTFDLAKSLVEIDRLRSVRIAPDNPLASFGRGPEVSRKSAQFDQPVSLGAAQWKLGGTCGLGNRDDTHLPELVLITAASAAEAERIVAVAAPLLPETFFERRSQRQKYPAHFQGWSETLESENLPKGMVTLRTYAFDDDGQSVRPIAGVHTIEVPAK